MSRSAGVEGRPQALGAQNDIVVSLQPTKMRSALRRDHQTDSLQLTCTDNWATTFNQLRTASTYPTTEYYEYTLGPRVCERHMQYIVTNWGLVSSVNCVHRAAQHKQDQCLKNVQDYK
jgi:hypothetical protein